MVDKRTWSGPNERGPNERGHELRAIAVRSIQEGGNCLSDLLRSILTGLSEANSCGSLFPSS